MVSLFMSKCHIVGNHMWRLVNDITWILVHIGQGEVWGVKTCKKNFYFNFKVRNRAKIRNQYNQALHLTQDTNGK